MAGAGLIDGTYRQVLFGMPYCSVSPYFRMAAVEPPEKFGGNCIDQAEVVVDKLTEAGLKASYAVDGRHHAVVVRAGGRTYYVDPYLAHKHAIDLSRIFARKSGFGEYGAYPTVRDTAGRARKGYLSVQREAGRAFQVKKGRFSRQQDEYKDSTFRFSLRALAGNRTAPDDYWVNFHPEQNTLSIRVLDPESQGMMHLVYPIHKYFAARVISKKGLYVKLNDGNRIIESDLGKFNRAVDIMADMTGSHRAEMINFVMQGVRYYYQYAPRSMNFHSINPSNH